MSAGPKLDMCHVKVRACETDHVASEACGGHGREVRRAGVLITPADDAHATELAYFRPKSAFYNRPGLDSRLFWTSPLWKLSSMGGIILYTLLAISFCDTPAMIVVPVFFCCRKPAVDG